MQRLVIALTVTNLVLLLLLVTQVKLGAGTDGSGLLLADETSEVGIHLLSRRAGTSERPNTTSITMRGAEGQERVIGPEQP